MAIYIYGMDFYLTQDINEQNHHIYTPMRTDSAVNDVVSVDVVSYKGRQRNPYSSIGKLNACSCF